MSVVIFFHRCWLKIEALHLLKSRANIAPTICNPSSPSPLWGGLGWGFLRRLRFSLNLILEVGVTPTLALPTRGREKKVKKNEPG
jgi:hypothetical protein